MSWLSVEDREYWDDAEARYLQWCEDNDVDPYKCEAVGCDRYIPCRKHPPKIEE